MTRPLLQLRGSISRPRPLARRALAIARRLDRLAGNVVAARTRIHVPRLGDRVAAARAPKLLPAATRLAPVAAGDAFPPAATGPGFRGLGEMAAIEAVPFEPAVEVEVARTVAVEAVPLEPAVELARTVAVPLEPAVEVARTVAVRSEPAIEVARTVAVEPDAGIELARTAAVEPVAPAPGVGAAEPVAHAVEGPTVAREQARPSQPDPVRLLRSEPEPPPPGLSEDMHFLWDVWQREKRSGRGVLERSRGARILEGARLDRDVARSPARESVPQDSPAPAPPATAAPEAAADQSGGDLNVEAQPSPQSGRLRISRTAARRSAAEPSQPVSAPVADTAGPAHGAAPMPAAEPARPVVGPEPQRATPTLAREPQPPKPLLARESQPVTPVVAREPRPVTPVVAREAQAAGPVPAAPAPAPELARSATAPAEPTQHEMPPIEPPQPVLRPASPLPVSLRAVSPMSVKRQAVSREPAFTEPSPARAAEPPPIPSPAVVPLRVSRRARSDRVERAADHGGAIPLHAVPASLPAGPRDAAPPAPAPHPEVAAPAGLLRRVVSGVLRRPVGVDRAAEQRRPAEQPPAIAALTTAAPAAPRPLRRRPLRPRPPRPRPLRPRPLRPRPLCARPLRRRRPSCTSAGGGWTASARPALATPRPNNSTSGPP